MRIRAIWDSLFKKQDGSLIGHNGPPSDESHNSFAIPVPEDYPPELLVRVPLHQPRDPSRKGKSRTVEEAAADHKAWLEGTMRQARLRFEFDRSRAERIGVTHYRWHAMDGYGCSTCRSRNGGMFPLWAPPGFRHPGHMMCVSDYDYGDVDDEEERTAEPCRCWYEMIVPD